ncbi:MAG: hypothetical protein WCQ96_01495 [Patescibacteria group bacterium]
MDKYSDSIDIDQIVSVNLKYNARAIPLKNLAFAQLCAKVLFVRNEALTKEEIASEISKLIHTKGISIVLVGKSLQDFSGTFGIEKMSNKWSLSGKERERILEVLKSNNLEKEKVLTKHFTKEIDIEVLKDWFYDAVSIFFGAYGDELVKSICKNIKPNFSKIKTLEEILEVSIEKHKLSKYKDDLVRGFVDFISSNDREDLILLNSLIRSMFFARLVASEVSADPLTVNEIEKAKIIVDTNVFFALALESHKISGSLNSFGDTLSKLNCETVYIRPTKEEYNRVVNSRQSQIINLLDKFNVDVVLDSNDDFVKTAKARGCRTKEDCERFFESIREMPEKFSENQNIQIEEYEEIVDNISNAEKDSKLKERLRESYKETKPSWFRSKTETALSHDVALFYVIDLLRQERKNTYVLTLDRSLQKYSSDILSKNTSPKVISLDALIQLLSINFCSDDYDAVNYTPLFANVLLSQFHPPENIYTIEDLYWFHKIYNNTANLPSGKVKEIVNIVAKERMSGKKIEDTYLQLRINRICEREEGTIKQEIEAQEEKRRDTEKKYEEEKEKRIKREGQLIEGKIKDNKKQLDKELFYRCITILLISILLYYIAKIKYNDASSFLMSIVSFLGQILYDNPFIKYMKKVKGLPEDTKRELGIS